MPLMVTTNSEPHQNLPRLLVEARARVEAMTPAERAEMHEAQRQSWVRGEMGMERMTEDRMTTITDDMVEAALVNMVANTGVQIRRSDVRAALEATERAAWRPAENKPPERTWVLLAWARGKEPIALGCWRKSLGWRDERGRRADTPTHWRPLPAGPEEER